MNIILYEISELHDKLRRINIMSEDKANETTSVCKFCNSTENERPIFKTRFKGEKLYVCAKCLPGLIHG